MAMRTKTSGFIFFQNNYLTQGFGLRFGERESEAEA
jgi:hypothetical protein